MFTSASWQSFGVYLTEPLALSRDVQIRAADDLCRTASAPAPENGVPGAAAMPSTGARTVVLVGETRSGEFLAQMRDIGWGRMWTVMCPAPYECELWGFDNGAYSAWLKGDPFPSGRFQARLEAALKIGTPLLAVAPDIVADGQRSLEFSLSWRERLPDEWPWYLAVQDGMDPADVTDALPAFAGLFLGGSTRFKGTAGMWCDLAHAQGKRFHFGRASLPRRVDHALRIGADSLDTSFPLWTKERWREFVRHWTDGSPQADIFLPARPRE